MDPPREMDETGELHQFVSHIRKDNLELFRDILQYRNSVLLEWIVIILIAIEVVNFFVQKII